MPSQERPELFLFLELLMAHLTQDFVEFYRVNSTLSHERQKGNRPSTNTYA